MMPAVFSPFCRPAGLLAGLFLAALLLSPAYPLAAFEPAQGASVDIYDRECVFWLDFDGDGEGDRQIEDGPDSYVHQETPVVGYCQFKVNTSVESTLLLNTELREWSSEVEIVSEPGLPERKVLQPGKAEISGLYGGIKITVEHRGQTPRSGKTRTLKDDYEHEVQIPRDFRLLEITITTPAGRDDRLEVSSISASSAYIGTQERISGQTANENTDAPDNLLSLASDLLEEGYPQIADRVLDVEEVSDKSVNWWMWIIIGIAILILVSVGTIFWQIWQSRRRSSQESLPSTRRGGNM